MEAKNGGSAGAENALKRTWRHPEVRRSAISRRAVEGFAQAPRQDGKGKTGEGAGSGNEGKGKKRPAAAKRSENGEAAFLEHQPQGFGEKRLHGGFLFRRQHPQTPRDLGFEIASDVFAVRFR